MKFICTKDLYFEDGQKVFTKGRIYVSDKVTTHSHFFQNDQGEGHSITSEWLPFFRHPLKDILKKL